MNYEKEYKEALERAKRLRDSKYQTMNAKRVAEEIFPVLAESEDERIRKNCIHFLKLQKTHHADTSEIDDCIAYLEKQKEQKPAECADDVVSEAEEYTSKVSCGEYGVEVTEAYIAGVLSERNRGTWWSEKDERMRNQLICDVEHHKKEGLISAKQNKATKALYSEIEKCYDEKIAWLKSLRPQIIDSAPLYTIEQVDEKIRETQEWSEEDEKKRNGLIKGLQNRMGFGWASDPFSREDYIVWLKSIRPQPKVELTLLDKNIIDAAVAFIEQNDHFNCWRGVDKHTVIKALRSLKPRWKPSEEQMNALEEVRAILHHHHLWDEINPILYDYEELMRDLQKLL